MILKMFCIYDRQTEIYHPPLYAHSVGHIIRVVGDIFKNPESPFHAHPGDYDLFEVGNYDDSIGHVEPLDTNHKICGGNELSPPVPPKPHGDLL